MKMISIKEMEAIQFKITEMRFYGDQIAKIVPILGLVGAKLSDTDFNFLIRLLRGNDRSHLLDIYNHLQNIIKKYEPIINNNKAWKNLSLTKGEERDVLIYISTLLKQERFNRRLILRGKDRDFEKVPFIPEKKQKRISLREYALKQGLNYETFRALLRKYPTLASEIAIKEIMGKKILYSINDSSAVLSAITMFFRGYESAKSLYTGWIKLVRQKKEITKSGATKWMQRKVSNGVVPPEFFYCKTYIPTPVCIKTITELFWKIDKSNSKPVIPKECWKQGDERKVTYKEIIDGLQKLETNARKRITQTKRMLKQTYQPFMSKLTSLGN